MSQRPVYENITSPSYKRFFVPTACFGDKTRGILLYRETGSDTWTINYNETYYSKDLNAAKNNTSRWFKYLGTMDIDSLLVSCMADALMKLKTTDTGGTECTEQA